MHHKLFKISIDDLSGAELEARLVSFLYSNKTKCVATPNAEMLVDAQKDQVFQTTLQETDLNLPDTVSLRFAVSALTNQKLKNRHTGVDTLQTLIKLCEREGKSVLFFGADSQTAKAAIKSIDTKAKIDFIDPGTVALKDGKLEIERNIINQIQLIKPDVVTIALPHKKQLAFMWQFKDELQGVKVMIGVGGALDMISGRLKRAPKWMRKIGMEWLWRLLIEPRRIGRIAKASIVFPALVAIEALRKHRFIKAVRNTAPEIIKQLTGR